MSQCVKCGTVLSEHAKFCPNCGAKVGETAATECRHCGSPLKPAAQFCHSCGQPVEGAEAFARRASTIESSTTGGKEADGDTVAGLESHESASPAPRSWKTTLLPLLGIPVIFVILWLLLHKKQNPQPVSESTASTERQTDGEGMNMAAMEEISKQIEKYKGDLQANPKDTTALFVLGHIYEMANRFDEAADYYRRYLDVVPDNLQARMNLAGIYYNRNQRQQALNELQTILKYQPKYDFAMYNLGVIYLAEGNQEEASRWWHKVMETNPTSELAEKAREQLKAMGGK